MMNENSGYIGTFWALAEGQDTKRIKAANDLVRSIEDKQGQDDEVCEDLTYTLTRLVKGLASNRKWARVGFALGLTQVLREFPVVTLSSVFGIIKRELKLLKSDTKGEQSSVLLGRVMAYLAVLQAERLGGASVSELQQLTQGLVEMGQKKAPLHTLCTQGLVQLTTMVGSSGFKQGVWPVLESELTCGWDKCTPDTLSILLAASQSHQKQVDKKFLSAHWGCKSLLAEKNYEAFGTVLANSTSGHPIIHPVCSHLLQALASNPSAFTAFWQAVINEKLLGQSMQKKYLCLHLVPVAASLVTSQEQMEVVFSTQLVGCIMKSLGPQDKVLSTATKHMLEQLSSFMSGCHDSSIQVAMVSRLLEPPASVLFDSVTQTRTVANWISSLKIEGLEEFAKKLKIVIIGKEAFGPMPTESGSKGPDLETQQKWAVMTLSNMVTHVAMATKPEAQLGIMQFLFLHAFFEVKKAKKGIPECGVAAGPHPTSVQHSLQEAFFRSLSRLATFNPDKSAHHDKHAYIDLLHSLVSYAHTLRDQGAGYVQANKPLNTQASEAWDAMMESVQAIRQKHGSEGALNENHAFELLFLHHGLQLYTDPRSALNVLQELHDCHKKAGKKKKRKSISAKAAVEDEEPAWVDVVVDLLLSLLSQQSHLVRVVVITVFRMLCPHLTGQSLRLVLDVMSLKAGGEEDGPLQFDDDDDNEEDMSSEETDEQMEEEDEEASDEEKEEEESDSSSDDDDGDEGVPEEARKVIREALGTAAVDSDEESGEEMDDDAMFRLDDTLAAAFRSMSRGGRKKDQQERGRQLKHYKLRCLDLIEVYIQSGPPPSVLLAMVTPLLDLVQAGDKDKELSELGARARKALHLLCKPTKLCPDPAVDKEDLPDMIQEMIQRSAKVSGFPMVKEVASVCLFVVRVMLGLESDTGPSPLKTRSMAATAVKDRKQDTKSKDTQNLEKVQSILQTSLQNFCEKRDTNLNHTLFINILERQPSLMWPIADTLLGYITHTDVRIFCKTQVCSMLAAMISKKTVQEIGDDTWTEFVPKVVDKVVKVVVGMSGGEGVKPKYLHELLSVLHRVLIVSEVALLQSLLPGDLLEKLVALKKDANKDNRTACNRIIGLINSRKLKPDSGEGDGGQKTKRKRKNSATESTTKPEATSADSSNTVSPAKKPKADLDLSTTSKSTSKKKDKKKRKSLVEGGGGDVSMVTSSIEEGNGVVGEKKGGSTQSPKVAAISKESLDSSENVTSSKKKKKNKRKSTGAGLDGSVVASNGDSNGDANGDSPSHHSVADMNTSYTELRIPQKKVVENGTGDSDTENIIEASPPKTPKSPKWSPVSSKTRRKSKGLGILAPDTPKTIKDTPKKSSLKTPAKNTPKNTPRKTPKSTKKQTQ